jgi:NTE family protein
MVSERQADPARRQALVLGGGGAFGVVQAAYISAAIEAGFSPSLVVGTSVGALNGAWLATRPAEIGGLLEIWLGLSRLRVLPHPLRLAAKLLHRPVSIAENQIVPRLLERHLACERIEDTPIDFAVVATNLSRGRKHVFRSGPMLPAIMASTAIPGVFEPVEIEGDLYVDGCLTGAVDLATAAEMGATEILAIDLTPPALERTPKTVVGVLRQSLGILVQATTTAMEQCLSPQMPVRVVRPDLSQCSAWRLEDAAVALNENLAIARREMSSLLASDGSVLPGPARIADAPAVRRASLPRRTKRALGAGAMQRAS